jgi:hypothetical protein
MIAACSQLSVGRMITPSSGANAEPVGEPVCTKQPYTVGYNNFNNLLLPGH